MGLYDAFQTDANLEKEGVWLDYGTCRVKVGYAGATNKKFASYSEAKFKPIRRAIEAGTIDNARSLAILTDVYAETIVLDWATQQGVDANDEPIFVRGIEQKGSTELLPFNKENVVKTFKALPNLFIDIKGQAESIATFRAQDMEADSGNSVSS